MERYHTTDIERVKIAQNTPVFAYQIKESLYLNLTPSCTNNCYFCLRFRTDYFRGYNLHLNNLPNASELIFEINYPRRYREIVFRGFGEPTLRLGVLKQVAKWIKENSGKTRLITNGQGNLIHHRNIVPELVGWIDAITVTLNADNSNGYEQVCHPTYGPKAFPGVIDFIRESVKYIPKVEVTAFNIPEVDLTKCMNLSMELGAHFRYKTLKIS